MRDKVEGWCQATVFGPRVHSWQCTRKPSVWRDGKGYCKQHDPKAVEARRVDRELKWKAKTSASDAVAAEGARLARRLKLKHAGCDYDRRTYSYVRRLVVPFEELEKLIARMK